MFSRTASTTPLNNIGTNKMAALFVVPRSEQRTFLGRTCSLDNFTDQQVVNRYRLDRGPILDIEREYATPKFATKTRRSMAMVDINRRLISRCSGAVRDGSFVLAPPTGFVMARHSACVDNSQHLTQAYAGL